MYGNNRERFAASNLASLAIHLATVVRQNSSHDTITNSGYEIRKLMTVFSVH